VYRAPSPTVAQAGTGCAVVRHSVACGGPFCAALFGRTWRTCLHPRLNKSSSYGASPVIWNQAVLPRDTGACTQR